MKERPKYQKIHWVLIDRQKLGISTETPRIFGSVTAMARAGIEDNGKILSEDNLRTRLSHGEKGERYWKNERYIVKEAVLEQSKVKNKKL